MAIDARLAYDTWIRLIADEELYRAMIDGTHRELAASRNLSEDQLVVLDMFRAEKGTRWNIENLRFRTALEVGGTLASYLPRTLKLLTNGDDNWLQDICFEYLSYYRWQELGHHRFTECERFASYTRERIMKRRITPPHLETVLEFELAVIRVLKRTASARWPAISEIPDADLDASRLRRGECVELVDLPVDIRDWVMSANPLAGTVRPRPVTFLIYVPSLDDTHRIKILGEGPKEVLGRFTGERTTAEVARELEDELGIESSELFALARSWLGERILVVDQSG